MIGINDPYRAPVITPEFKPGDLVFHRRYQYRGVVVEYDACFAGDDDWYLNNQTQPERNQPWYRVLVDGSGAVTYAAQSSLKSDPLKTPIKHTLVAYFFDGFENDSYIRNDNPWPSIE